MPGRVTEAVAMITLATYCRHQQADWETTTTKEYGGIEYGGLLVAANSAVPHSTSFGDNAGAHQPLTDLRDAQSLPRSSARTRRSLISAWPSSSDRTRALVSERMFFTPAISVLASATSALSCRWLSAISL